MEFFVLYIIVLLITVVVLGVTALLAWIAVNTLGKFFSRIFPSEAFSERSENEDNDISERE